MQFKLEFDICALILLLMNFTMCCVRKTIPLKRNRIYKCLLLTVMLTAALDIASVLIMRGDRIHPVQIDYLISYLYYVLQYSVPYIGIYYVLTWADIEVTPKLPAFWLCFVIMLFQVSILIANLFNHCLFYFDENGIYQYGNMVPVFVVSAALMLLYMMWIIIRHGERIMRIKKIAFVFFVFSIIGASVFQRFFPEYLTIGFASAIGMWVFFVAIQNPQEDLDAVTGLFNRMIIPQYFKLRCSKRKPFAIIVLAMDDFKFINKMFGTETGDAMLYYVAQFLVSISGEFRVFRWGSDQFCMIVELDEMSLEDATTEICERFRHPWIFEGVSVMMSTTVGCLRFPEDAYSVSDIMDIMDYLIMVAKSKGKGSVVHACDISLDAVRREKAVEKAVKLAIDCDLFEVYYQPIYDTKRERYVSAEALVRLHDDLLGWISPEEFIPIAEKNGSILRLGTIVFRKVFQFMRDNSLQDLGIDYIEINTSAVQCMQTGFARQVIELMSEYEIDPKSIVLEVTETAAVGSMNLLSENMQRLTKAGIHFALDDYGSGYASLGYVYELPFKMIKLDKLMIWDAFANQKALITLKHSINMLSELDKDIVAEGVETEEQREYLDQMGCDYLQGYYFSKAIKESEFLSLVKYQNCKRQSIPPV